MDNLSTSSLSLDNEHSADASPAALHGVSAFDALRLPSADLPVDGAERDTPAGTEKIGDGSENWRDELGRAYLRHYGIKPPGEPEEDPHGGQCPKQHRIDRSLGRLHGVSSAGIGLGVATALYSACGSVVAVGTEIAIDIVEGLAGTAGFIGWFGAHRHLARHAFPNDRGMASLEKMSHGYTTGLGQVALPSVLAACAGFGLYETHAATALASFLTASCLLAAYQFIRHGRFLRDEPTIVNPAPRDKGKD